MRGALRSDRAPDRAARAARAHAARASRRAAPGASARCAGAARRDPRSLRRAGDRVHRVAGPEPGPGRGPDHLSDLGDAARGAAACASCAAQSFFGISFVYAIFEDGTDLYWARSRVLEYLSGVRGPAARGRRRPCSAPTPPASAGSSSTRWSTAAASSTSPAAQPAGLEPALRARRACRASPRSPRSAASCGSTRSRSIRTGCARSASRSAR